MDSFDKLILIAIALLVFFAAIAFGGVDVWAVKIEEQICFSLLLLWLAKSVVCARNAAVLLGKHDMRSLAPVVLLLGFVSFQLMPMRPALLRALSPHTYELYRTTLAGWPSQPIYDDARLAQSLIKERTAPAATILPTVDEVQHGAAVPFGTNAVRPVLSVDSSASVSLRPVRWHISMPLSVAPPLTRAGLLKCAAYASLFFLVGFYPAGDGGRRAERNFRRGLLLTVLAGGTAVAALGLLQQAFWNGRILWFHVPRDWGGPMPALQRASGPFANPDHFANYLAMVLPLALSGALFRTPLEKTESFSGFQLFCATGVVLMVAAIIASLSRAGWLEIGLGVLSLAWVLVRRRGQRVSDEAFRPPGGPVAWILLSGVGLLSAVAIALMLIGPVQTQQVGTRVVGSLSNGVGLQDRWAMWMDSARILSDYPLFGIGLGSWPVIFTHYQRPPWSMYFAGEAQNDYVEAAVEYGITGVLLFAWMCFAVARTLIRGSRSLDPVYRPLFAAVLPAIVIMSFHELVDFCLQIPANAILFVLLVALALRLVRSSRRPPSRTERYGLGWLIGTAGLALAALACIAGATYQRETVYPDDLHVPASIQECTSELLSHPASALPHIWLADIIHGSTGIWPVNEVQNAVWLAPDNPEYRDRYVLALVSAGKNHEALHQLTHGLLVAPHLDDHPLLNLRLLPWMPASERLAAEAGLKAAVARGYEGSVESLARLYGAEGREADAASTYDEEARREQNGALRFQYYLAAGQAYATANRRSAAAKAFRAAITLAPEDRRPYENLITLVHGPQKDGVAAEKVIQIATDQGISPAALYLLLSQAASDARDPSLAEGALLKAIDYEPSYPNLMLLGDFYLDRAQFDLARDAFRRAVQVNPQSARAHFTLAQAEEGAYDFSAARSDYQQAVALAPDHPEFKTRLNQLSIKIARELADHS